MCIFNKGSRKGSDRILLASEIKTPFRMAWVLLFFALLGFSAGVTSQPTLTQPDSQSVSPGQTATLSCSKGSGSWSSYVHWVQQKPGEAPRYVHCNGCSRGPGIPDRFTATASGNTGTLTITNVQAGDEAVYYCYVWSDTASMYVFGPGTHLTVLGQPTAPPTVHLFPPSQEEIKNRKKATLVCLIDAFYPGAVQVDWLADGTAISSGVETTKPTKQGDKYVASSYLTLGQTDWESHSTYTCKVRHEGKDFEKVVTKSSCA